MIDYRRSKIYVIKNKHTGHIIWFGGTVSSLSRRYYNHRSNHKDILYNVVEDLGLNWDDLIIDIAGYYETCRNRKTLSFAAEVASTYDTMGDEQVLNDYLQNIDSYIDSYFS